jgi:hypothetical protein
METNVKPKMAIEKRVAILNEIYHYLKDSSDTGKIIKWYKLTRKHAVSAGFSSIIIKMGIIKQINTEGYDKYYKWNVAEPNLALALRVLEAENQKSTEKRVKQATKIVEVVDERPKIRWRFPISIKFRSILYIKDNGITK